MREGQAPFVGLQGEAAQQFAGVDEAPTSSPEIWRLVDW